MNLRLVWLFLSAIPDLIKLLQEIDKARIAAETDRKVTDDLKTLHQAFANKDAQAVTKLFNGGVAPAPGSDGVRP